jgi:hypothetical protein
MCWFLALYALVLERAFAWLAVAAGVTQNVCSALLGSRLQLGVALGGLRRYWAGSAYWEIALR